MDTSKNLFKTNRNHKTIKFLIITNDFFFVKELFESLKFSTHVFVDLISINQSMLYFESFNFKSNSFKDKKKLIDFCAFEIDDYDLIIDDLKVLPGLKQTKKKFILSKSGVKNYELQFQSLSSGLIKFSLIDGKIRISKIERNSSYIEITSGDKLESILKSLRLYGINIWLSIVQDLMTRKQDFYQLIPESSISFDSFKIKLNSKNVFFDLDETLVLLDKPVHETINFLNECLNQKINIHLITRHIYNVEVTLKKIGIDIKVFNTVKVLNIEEKKSSIINCYDITEFDLFIDNEFKERIDVLLNSKILVADLNMIQFFQFEIK